MSAIVTLKYSLQLVNPAPEIFLNSDVNPMKTTTRSTLQTCISNQLVVGLQIRYVPAMIFLCIEWADDQTLVVRDRDINGFEIPFRRRIKIIDILNLKITNTRFDDPDLISIRQSYNQRETFLTKPSTSYYVL
jgi:hypothetical protein